MFHSSDRPDFVSQLIAIDFAGSQVRHTWTALIEDTLSKWLRDPSYLEDEEIDPPSAAIIRLAMDLAFTLRDRGEVAPSSIVPDASGGIVFERRSNSGSESYHIWDDASVEYFRFEGTAIVERRSVPPVLPVVQFWGGNLVGAPTFGVVASSGNLFDIEQPIDLEPECGAMPQSAVTPSVSDKQGYCAVIKRLTSTAAIGAGLFTSVTASTTLG